MSRQKVSGLTDTVKLNNGVAMPWLGLGTWKAAEGAETINAVRWALEIGYRHIDTAAIYGNETSVGQAIRESGVDRGDIFLTTKLWNDDQRSGRIRQAFEQSLKRLDTDYVDLYLLHWPVAGKFVETWKVLEKLHAAGRIRAIGVSNFMVHHLEELLPTVTIKPAVNQVEFHPYLLQEPLLHFNLAQGIQPEAWSPIIKGRSTDDPVLSAIGAKYGKTGPQVCLRWELQRGVVTIPKSTHRDRIQQNAEVFDFQLTDEEMARIDGLDRNERVGPDPHNFSF